MDPHLIIIIILAVISVINAAVTITVLIKLGALQQLKRDTDTLRNSVTGLRSDISSDTSHSVQSAALLQEERFKTFDIKTGQQLEAIRSSMESRLTAVEQSSGARLDKIQSIVDEKLQKALDEKLTRFNLMQEERFKTFGTQNEQQLEAIRQTVERRLSAIQQDNNTRLDKMQGIVDEKLQKTLDERLTNSFALVNQRLEQVYKGLGEMQTLASGVGDLSKVLSNVKSRGIIGEIQLGAILAEIMSPEQYLTDTPVRSGSTLRVEYAVKLPNSDGSFILLPIDSKFPTEPYIALTDAYDSGRPEDIKAAQEALKARIKSFAKDISSKYIAPPDTTDFAIMFLPTEGLYAEAVKLGLIEILQRDYRINIAGPSTMAALLNSLRMGFRTVAIEKRSSEVWKVLGAVKTEFEKFDSVLMKAQERLNSVNGDLDKLIGARSRQILRKLNGVESIPERDTSAILNEPDSFDADD